MLQIPKTVKMIITDFDGIMTDNTVFIDNDLNISRKINFVDVMGVSLLRKAGIEIAIISGEKNKIIELFSQRFNIPEIHQDIRKKIDILKNLTTKYNLKQSEFLYIGDDVNDKECLEFSTIKITVPNAVEQIKSINGIQVTNACGGNGAFREVADCLLNT